MTLGWQDDPAPDLGPMGPLALSRVALRATLIILTILAGLALLLPLRLIEAPLFGLRRPWTPYITRTVCRLSLIWMGLRYERRGQPAHGRAAVVANHSSWLDIFALNAGDCVHFVSKSEVAGWPGIGLLARVAGTLFIARERVQAKLHTQMLQDRLVAGQRVLFFPEGTSTDALRVLPFKTTLFEAFFAPELREIMWVQPVSVTYYAPDGMEARTYGWWGDMEFGPHLLSTLALARQGRVEVVYHPAIRVSDMNGRKALAAAAEAAVRRGHGLVQA